MYARLIGKSMMMTKWHWIFGILVYKNWTDHFRRLREQSANSEMGIVPIVFRYIFLIFCILSRALFPIYFSSAQISTFQDLVFFHFRFFTFFLKIFFLKKTHRAKFETEKIGRENRHARSTAKMSFNLLFLILNLPSHGVQFSHSNTCTSVLSPLRFIRKYV